MNLIINNVKKLQGEISFTGDKSISHRALMLASLANGESEIRNFSQAEDCLSTLNCLKQLGVEIKKKDDGYSVIGKGLTGLEEPDEVLYVGNSGTTIRILPGILAGQKFLSILSGDSSISKRPMDRIIKPLKEMGAIIFGRDNDRYAPIVIEGSNLKGINYKLPIASAQVKSCILMAGLFGEGETVVTEPVKSRDHTERIFDYLGIDIEQVGLSTKVRPSEPRTADYLIPGDFSTAFFYVVAAIITGNSEIKINGVLNNPTRNTALKSLIGMGANIKEENSRLMMNEPVADFVINSSELGATEIDGDDVPGLIDEIPALSIAATQANGRTVIRDAVELRVKESDRISAICTELKKMGADIEETTDGFIIDGPTKLKGANLSSHGDHRIAMSLAVAGLIAEGETVIEDAECINVSSSSFISDLEGLITK